MRRATPLIIGLIAAAVLIAAIVALVARGGDDHAAPPTTQPSTTPAPSTTTQAPSTTRSPTTTAPPATTAPSGTGADLPSELAIVTEPWETDWSRSTIDLSELRIGLPTIDPRDLIRPIDDPRYEDIPSGDEWLIGREIGIQIELDDGARFYPLRILTAHEIVNDEAAGVPFAVTYCPLCNTAVAFSRVVEGQVLRFGVSGLLRKSDLVMWDDLTQSLWQQISGEGIVGAYAGVRLELLPSAIVTWDDFKQRHPAGVTLSQDTGFAFNYGSNGYVGYSSRSAPFSDFFDDPLDDRFPALERVVGVRVGTAAKAYPFSMISEERSVNDEVNGLPIAVWWGDSDAADNFSGQFVGQGAAIGTGIAFIRAVDDLVLTFSPAGADTFTDAETSSTWTLLGEAVDGPLAGTHLELALHQNEFWFAWVAFNEGSPVYGA